LRILTQPGPFAFLKIAEGCDHSCSYCVIPKLRGKYCSRDRTILRREAETLAAQGVKELVLVAQDTTGYGKDMEGEELVDLLLELGEIGGIDWLRVLYAYPDYLSDRLIELIASHPKVCKYLDLSLQHCEERLLKRMGRQGNRQKLEELIQHLRTAIPGLTLRTTFIVGFPGETEEEFEGLLDFVKTMRFERLGSFKYSREEGTQAAGLPGQIPRAVKERRQHKLMKLQRGISLGHNRSLLGTAQSVLIDQILDSDPYSLAGRTMGHAPEVDGQVYTLGTAEVGDLVEVEIVQALEYDLVGRITERLPAKKLL
jgi:ribosomal protein S12 methylthiotransferase